MSNPNDGEAISKTSNGANCLFCKIVAKEIPSDPIYEDEDVYAFADIHPNNLGHTLVVPKKHSENIYKTDDADLVAITAAAKKVAIGMKKALGAEGVNIMMNNEKAAGQLIFHSHVHVIPRYEGDGYTHWKGPEKTKGEISEAAQKIKDALA